MELDEEKISRPSSRFVQENSGKSHTRVRQSARRELGYSDLNWDICTAQLFDAESGSLNTRETFNDEMRAMSDQTLLAHSERMARRKESINTHQEKYESALDRLQADMAEHDDNMARRFADFAKQRKDNLRWQIGISIVGIVVLGAVLRWPF